MTPMHGLTLAALTVLFDQVTKLWVLFGMGVTPGQSIPVLPFANIVMTFNTGVSYGLLAMEGQSWQYGLAAFAMVVAVILVIWMWREKHSAIAIVSIGLIVGGAIGNAIDRIHLPGVADFIQLHAFGAFWYVFNVADVSIVVGVLGLLYDMVWPTRDESSGAP